MPTNARFMKQPRIDADVQLLLGRFRDLLPDGTVIQHAEIERLLNLKRRDGRYQTVTKRWRQVLFEEQRIFLDGRAALGQGFKSLTPDDMVRYSNKRVRAIGRLLRKAIAVAALPQPNELSTDARVYQARLLLAAEQIMTTHKRVLVDLSTALKPPRQLPRVAG
jgi:hypothetical protein